MLQESLSLVENAKEKTPPMSRPVKITISIIGFVILLGALIGVLGYRLITKSLPDYSRDTQLSILDQPVQVVWDTYRVPHVFAQNSADMFRVAGYLVAQERLWQMELYRRIARGTLSEILGPETLDEDKLFRIIGFQRTAEAIAERLSDASRLALQAYADGINAFLETHLDKLPVEFSILGFKPEKWKISDSIGFSRVMAYQLSYTWHAEIPLYQIAARFGRDDALLLFPEYAADAPLIIAADAGAANDLFAAMAAVFQKAGKRLNGSNSVAASNSWVVAGQKSVSGKPILANDPHLGLFLPNIWYEMHLVSDEYDVMGATLPGAPGVLIGNNRHIAWGLTNGMVDDMDFYLERLDPGDSTRYWDGAQWQKLEILRQRIKVKGQDDPVFLDIRFTRHGPIISDTSPVLMNAGLAVSMQWTGHTFSDESLAILKLNKARNWGEFVDAVQYFKAPCQNIVFADVNGDIGYYAAGSVPIRRDGGGFFLYNGWDDAGDWVGMIPFAEMPHVKNPAAGYIATANNRMVSESYPYYLGNFWEPDSRIRRIVALLTAKEKLSVVDFETMQQDVHSAHAEKTLPILLASLENASLTNHEKSILKLLADWDFEEKTDRPEPTLYNALFMHLLENTLKDELGDTLFQDYTYWTNMPTRAMENLLMHPKARWWDDAGTPQVERMHDIIAKSFRETLQYLTENLGDGPGFWDWGRLHRLTLKHPFGEKKPMDLIFNRGPYPIGGSANSISKAEYLFSKPYDAIVGASMRQIVDFTDPGRAWRIFPGGQSGQPFSPAYDDQIPLWLNGEYKVSAMPRDVVASQALAQQTFRPKAN